MSTTLTASNLFNTSHATTAEAQMQPRGIPMTTSFVSRHFTPPQHNKKDNEVPTSGGGPVAVRQIYLREVQALPARGIAEETCRVDYQPLTIEASRCKPQSIATMPVAR